MGVLVMVSVIVEVNVGMGVKVGVAEIGVSISSPDSGVNNGWGLVPQAGRNNARVISNFQVRFI
jgi:hypothetical protein